MFVSDSTSVLSNEFTMFCSKFSNLFISWTNVNSGKLKSINPFALYSL